MKVKLNVDSDRLKRFFSLHVEKIAFGVFTLLFLQACYAAYQTKPYTKAPKDLKQTTESVRNTVIEQPWDAPAHNIKLPDPEIAVVIAAVNKPVAQVTYPVVPNPPVDSNKVRRDEPKLLALRELRGTYGFGYVPPKAAGPIPGKQWIVVTALVPVGDQTAEYKKMFDNATFVDPVKDIPHYDDFVIERADVTGLAPNAKPTWKELSLDDAANLDDSFAAERQEFVDKKLIEAFLCDRNPPLLGKTHDESVAHLPEIPYTIPAPEDKQKAEAKQPEQPQPGGRRGRKAAGDNAAPVPVPTTNAQANAAKVVGEIVPYKLFRFFDFTVENNHSYRYRVTAIVKNPNHGVVERALKIKTLADGETRTTPVSDPTPVINVPREFRLLAGAVVPPQGVLEARATHMTIVWAPQYGVEVSHVFDKQERGTILNALGVQTSIPVAGKPGQTTSGNIDYKTDTLLVDMTGGERLPGPTGKPVRAPAEIVLLGPDGKLVIRNQLVDGLAYTRALPENGKGGGGGGDGGDNADGAAPDAGAAPKAPGLFDFLKDPKAKK